MGIAKRFYDDENFLQFLHKRYGVRRLWLEVNTETDAEILYADFSTSQDLGWRGEHPNRPGFFEVPKSLFLEYKSSDN